jgi:hypothetical protein
VEIVASNKVMGGRVRGVRGVKQDNAIEDNDRTKVK